MQPKMAKQEANKKVGVLFIGDRFETNIIRGWGSEHNSRGLTIW